MTPTAAHRWEFRSRFCRNAFGWKSQPAIQRVKQAVAEIKKVARQDPVLAAEGAVTFLERLSPALERVDSSSGAIGIAVNHAIAELVPVIAAAPADAKIRAAWLERLFKAHEEDQIPYIESLADYWGELCGSPEVASAWADRLVGITAMALSPDQSLHGHFHGTSACLSALLRAERYAEIVDLVKADRFWPYRRWAVKALAAQGKKAEAIRYAEACRSQGGSDWGIDRVCEEILLAAEMVDEAYARYGLTANRGGTYLATFRAVAAKYPHKTARDILADLVQTTPGEEGKWFAAAKEAGLLDEALVLASRSPCDPKTLTQVMDMTAAVGSLYAKAAGGAPEGTGGAAARPLDAREIIARIEQAKAGRTSSRSQVELQMHLMGATTTMNGIEWARGGRSRQEMTSPMTPSLTIAIDDSTVRWSYQPEMKMVTRVDRRRVEAAAGPKDPSAKPSGFEGMARDAVVYVGREQLTGGEVYHLRGPSVQGQSPMPGLELGQVEVWIGARDGVVRRRITRHRAGEEAIVENRTEVEVNQELPDSLFTSSPELTDGLRGHIERRLRFALARVHWQVGVVTLLVRDGNGRPAGLTGR